MLTTAEMEQCSLDTALIGKRIKQARKAKHQTQEHLAGLCDCTPTHICNIENGKIGISLELLFKISILLCDGSSGCESRNQNQRGDCPKIDTVRFADAGYGRSLFGQLDFIPG